MDVALLIKFIESVAWEFGQAVYVFGQAAYLYGM